ncbi:MAG: hypothetical protein NC214_01890 [Candidatus Amulumruptor caecigallinarius]|nr:hypothetical protein [Candidatus Amulumruptor caecigallinarius]MCM1454185.1 hypothetical protein [bacterium]
MPNLTIKDIPVPAVGREERIGSVLNQVCHIMYDTENTLAAGQHKVAWDFRQCSFLHPYFLGALAILKQMYGETVVCRNIPSAISSYLDVVYFHKPLRIEEDMVADEIWSRYKHKTYLPICEFIPSNKSSVKAQELIQSTIKSQLGGRIHSFLSYLLSELIDNITDHSHSEVGYVFCQSIPRLNQLHVFIADTGRTIYSSYATDSRYSSLLSIAESSALLLALKGKSTKNRPENENRGYGISKSINLIVNGLGGEFFILSGSAFARNDAQGEIVADLPPELRWNGTIVLLKLPMNPPEGLNIYNYIV